MLKDEYDRALDLQTQKQKAASLLPEDLKQYTLPGEEILEIHYPVLAFPKKVKSVSFDKLSTIEGTLSGIKGQYLIFEDNTVLNIRKHGGYVVSVELTI